MTTTVHEEIMTIMREQKFIKKDIRVAV